MHGSAGKYSRRLARPLAFALALVALLYLAQVVPHSHANGHDEEACQLCQVGHIGVSPALSAQTLIVTFVSFALITVLPDPFTTETFSDHSPSRAPPSFPL